MEEALLQRVIELVCTRPRMFVWDGTFRTAAAYLDGYDNAIALIGGKGWQDTELRGFQAWLAHRFWASHGIARNLGWYSYIEKLYPDDEARFKQLPILFSEYLSHREQVGATV